MTKGEMKARYHEVQRHGGRNGQPVYRQYGTSAACVPKPIFLTDVKRKDPPTAEQPKTQEATE